jgi:phospholipid-binding lipoprotein MlaA
MSPVPTFQVPQYPGTTFRHANASADASDDVRKKLLRGSAMCILAFALTALAGCASTVKNPQDPLEGFNRAMFTFNDKVDQVALKPAAKTYKAVLPEFVQTGIGNFFGNIGDLSTALNNFLQGRGKDGMSDLSRVALNTVFGVVGLLDVATPAWGLPKHDQDFGQTLGRWGVASGPYLVLPLVGPTTTRDAVALPVDLETDLWSYKYPVRWRNTGSVVRIVDKRAYILDSTSLIEEAALDRYEFVRDAYLQRRQSQIYSGREQEPESDKKEPVSPPPDQTAPPAK